MKNQKQVNSQPSKRDDKEMYKNKLRTEDLKGKKVDAFPDTEADKPIDQKKRAE